MRYSSKNFRPQRYLPKKDEQEFGKGKGGYVICSVCKAVYFHKSWHHRLDDDFKHLGETKNKKVKFSICPACQWKKDKVFEGKLVIIDAPENKLDEIFNLIKNIDKEAQRRDPLDRVLWHDKEGDSVIFYFSENQLAIRTAKKLKSSFGGKLDIKHTPESPVFINLEFSS